MDLVFSTFNARYPHASLALRCLRAALGGLRERSVIIEFDNRLNAQDAVEKLLACRPRIILFSVYIWNRDTTFETARMLKQIRPELAIVMGGPEVSHDSEDSPAARLADHLVCGEGETVIEALCRDLLAGKPLPKLIRPPPADLKSVALPYDEYTDEDIAHRRIYVETSRGCPFKCHYCLSSLEPAVRFFPPERIFPAFEKLIGRGARIFKFLDRCFNSSAAHAAAVLQFFLDHRRDGMMLHLEWEPEHLPPTLEQLLAAAPPGFFQLEVGVQTFNPEVAARIERRLDPEKTEAHLRRLSALPSVHVHADLIAGLPGETLDSIAAGFDRLHACGPHEIQLGILKKLRGAPIARHDAEWRMIYNDSPPYDVLQTSALSFDELRSIRRFARCWDVTVNNGRFPHAAPLIWRNQPSVFRAFMDWSEWLWAEAGLSEGIAPARLGRFLEDYLVARRGMDPTAVRRAVSADLVPRTVIRKGIERQGRQSARAKNAASMDRANTDPAPERS